ncbi:MAG: ABC transporter permease [Spirochaetales bacterium]|nr:ABC transporter permease [Spirochaetales bacterium]
MISLSLLKKELLIHFTSSKTYFGGAFFLGFTGTWFFVVHQFFAQNSASFRAYFDVFPLVFLVLIPVLTMGIWAEEKKQGTYELLLTLPVGEWQLVGAKFLALVMVFGVMLLGTVPTVILVLPFGDFDRGVIITQYLGSFFLGLAELSLGQYMSSRSQNQMTAFLSTLGVLVLFTLLDRIVLSLGFNGPGAQFFLQGSFTYRYGSFVRGVIDTRDLVFFVILTWSFLFLNGRQLVHERWR